MMCCFISGSVRNGMLLIMRISCPCKTRNVHKMGIRDRSATWKYYVTKEPGDDTTWQNIDAELNALGKVEEKKDGVFYTTFEIPLKYTGYHFKAVLIGTDDYSSQVELVTPALEGKLLKGTADILSLIHISGWGKRSPLPCRTPSVKREAGHGKGASPYPVDGQRWKAEWMRIV